MKMLEIALGLAIYMWLYMYSASEVADEIVPRPKAPLPTFMTGYEIIFAPLFRFSLKQKEKHVASAYWRHPMATEPQCCTHVKLGRFA